MDKGRREIVMKLESITDAANTLSNEIDMMNQEISHSKAPIELLQSKQKRIDKLNLIYVTLLNYKYLEVFEQLEMKMKALQKIDSSIDGFLVEIKFSESLKNSAFMSIRSTNMLNLFSA